MELLIIAALAFAMMFWMSRRSKKQRSEAMSFRDSLEIGQEVMTGSGLFGVIVAVEDERITLETEGLGGARTVWLRAAIAKLVDPPVEFETDETDSEANSELDETLAGISDATEQQQAAAKLSDEDEQNK